MPAHQPTFLGRISITLLVIIFGIPTGLVLILGERFWPGMRGGRSPNTYFSVPLFFCPEFFLFCGDQNTRNRAGGNLLLIRFRNKYAK